MSDIAALVADNLDIWTSAIERKSGAGRGGGKRIRLYGLERLRALILDLAVRGKLVPQDAGDEPAEVLLSRLASNKAALTTSRRSRPTMASSEDTISIARTPEPKGWKAVPLAQIAKIIRGVTYGKSDASEIERSGLIALLRGHNIQSEINLDNLVYVPTAKVSPDQFLKAGDIVIAMSSGSADLVGKAAQFQDERDLSFGAFCGVIRPVSEVIQTYLAFFCQTPFYRNQTHKGGKGIGIQNLSKGDLEKLVCPVPPLAEQQRIVAKVDELMALCDALERESADAMAAHQMLVETLLTTLVNSADAADLATNWARLETHFDTLFTTDASIDALKQAILDLAVRGKLVEQEARDEPAHLLLKRIAKEISAFCIENRISPSRTDPVKPTEPLFEVPHGWAWSRLAGIFKVITDGDHQPPPKADQGVAFLTIGNVTTGKLDFDGCRLVPQSYYNSLARYRTPAIGDILYTVVGATYGRPALVETDRRFCVQRHIAILKPSASMDVRYLAFLLSSPLVYQQASEGTTGSAQPTIALRPLRNFLVPLPPLAEQHRIVAKVDALMALCDALKAHLAAAAQTQRHLADAITERAAA